MSGGARYAIVALLASLLLMVGCSSAPSAEEARTDMPVKPPRFVPKKDREVVSSTPETPPLWYADYDAWRAKERRRRDKTFIIATGEGITESQARRNAFQEVVSSRSLSRTERGWLNLAGTPYVVAYSDGSFKVTVIYEFARPYETPSVASADVVRPYQEAIEYLCDDLLEQLSEAKRAELGTVGVTQFGYKKTPFPCEFSDFLESELRRTLQRRVGNEMKVLDPALMKPESVLAVPGAAVGGHYWPGENERTVRVQARMTDMTTGALLGTASVNLSIGNMSVRLAPLKADEAEKNLAAVDKLRASVRRHSGRAKNFKIKVWLEGGRRAWRESEKLVFHFRSERDCYLNLLHFDSAGSVQLLFPNQWHPDGFVRGGRNYTIPSREMNFVFEVDEPYGTDIVLAVATAVKTKGLYAFRRDQDIGFRSIEGGTRGILVKPTNHIGDLSGDQKAEAVLTFTTMP